MSAQSCTFKFDIDTTDPSCAFAIKVLLDSNEVWNCSHLVNKQTVEIAVNDNNQGSRCVEIHVSGKTQNDTKIDSNGNIVKDSLIKINNIQIHDVPIDHVFYSRSTYCHDFNGTADSVTVKFTEFAGCNGYIKFDFSSPVYLWLLENV